MTVSSFHLRHRMLAPLLCYVVGDSDLVAGTLAGRIALETPCLQYLAKLAGDVFLHLFSQHV